MEFGNKAYTYSTPQNTSPLYLKQQEHAHEGLQTLARPSGTERAGTGYECQKPHPDWVRAKEKVHKLAQTTVADSDPCVERPRADSGL